MAGLACLSGPAGPQNDILDQLKLRRDALVDALLNIDGVKVSKPETTFYLFPDVTDIFKRKGYSDSSKFRLDALYETGVSFCSREHFGRPLPGEDKVFIRFAYSGINVDQIQEGLAALKGFWE